MKRLSLMLFCFTIPGVAQHLTISAAGGLRMTGDGQAYGSFDSSASKFYLVGPAIEVQLPLHFALEADALYSRLGKTTYLPFIANEFSIRTIANSWEFPLLAKYRFPIARIHPHVSGGFELRRAGGAIHTIHYGYYPSDVTFSSTDWHGHDFAYVLGGGVDFDFGRFRVSPELRYVRWTDPSSTTSGTVAFSLLVPQNEGQVLLEIGWRAR